VGFTSTLLAAGNIDPVTRVNSVGFGWTTGDTNIQFMHNASLASATKINLGAAWPIPTVDRTSAFKAEIHVTPNNTSVSYRLTNLGTGAQISGTVTTNLPTVGTGMVSTLYVSAGTTSSLTGIGIGDIKVVEYLP
jgi:hypothetical protein